MANRRRRHRSLDTCKTVYRAEVRTSARTGRDAFTVGPPLNQQLQGSERVKNTKKFAGSGAEVGHLPKWRWGTSHAPSVVLSLCSNGESQVTCSREPRKLPRADAEPASSMPESTGPAPLTPLGDHGYSPMDRQRLTQSGGRASPTKWKHILRADKAASRGKHRRSGSGRT
jgi:hypothetical protein